MASRRAPALRWPWLAGSLALHLLLAALLLGLPTRAPLELPAPALEVDLVAAPPQPTATAAPPSAPMPDAAPLPVAALPEPVPLPAPTAVATAEPPPDPLPPAEPPAQPVEPPPPTAVAPPAMPPPPPVAMPRPRPAPPQPAPQRKERRVTVSAQAAPAAPQSTPAPAPAKSAEPAAPQADWDQLVSAWLAAHRSYPEAARRRGETGAVTLRIGVAADGRVTEVSVVDATGSPDLTEAAVALLSGATLPPPRVPTVRTVRLRYRLEN